MTNPVSTFCFFLYGCLGYVFQPFSGLFLRFRARKGKEDPSRIPERYGVAPIRPLGRQVIWVHAASLGETNAVIPLVKRIVEKNFEVVFTTVTVTAAKRAEMVLPKGAVHQYSPLDLKPYVDRFLRHWQPSLAIFVESELWPTTMTELSARNIPQIIVNGRMSERSFQRWKRVSAFTRTMFSNIALCAAQSEADANRFFELGVANVVDAGNLKFDTDPPTVDTGLLEALQNLIGDRPVWLAASTHEKEELIVAKAHAALRKQFPGLLTLIVPRHPHRGGEISDLLRQNDFKVALRSRNEELTADTDLYIGDTIGELGMFYRLSPCSLIGGSLVPHGGQNPIEPASLGSAVIYGPNVSNFLSIFEALEHHGGGSCVRNSQELVERVADILNDSQKQQRMNAGAKVVLKKFGGALDRTHNILLPYLNPLLVVGSLASVDAQKTAGE